MFDNWTWHLGFFDNISDLLSISSICVLLSGAILTNLAMRQYGEDFSKILKYSNGMQMMLVGFVCWTISTILGIF